MKKRFMLQVEGKEIEEKLKEKLREGIVKTFESSDTQVVVEDADVLSDEEKKKQEEDAKNKEIKEKKIEELTQQYEAVSKLQSVKDTELADLKSKVADLEKQLQEKTDALAKAQADVEVSKKASTETATKLAEFTKNAKTDAIKTFVKQQVSEGKILPKNEQVIVALMEQLDDKAVIKFTKDDKETSEPLAEVIKKFISELPAMVNFNEIAPNIEHKVYEDKISIGGVSYEVKDIELVQKAEKYAQENKVEFDVALLAVSQETK